MARLIFAATQLRACIPFGRTEHCDYTVVMNKTQTTSNVATEFFYPRRQPIRFAIRKLAHLGFALLANTKVIGRENLPKTGPLIVVANHFHFADPAAILRATPWPLDFLGGTQMLDTPPALGWLPNMWGIYRVRRGTAARLALNAAKSVLAQNGVLGIFPEGGSWASVLRPARPGTAFLAAETGAPLLPIGLDGLVDLFPRLRKAKRATVTIRIGRPFGPFQVQGKGRVRRRQLEEIGHEIMGHIADQLPPERRGVYSTDPIIRATALKVAAYPYDALNAA